MKKLRLFGCLLMIIGLTACGKDEDSVPPPPSGQFVHDGIARELHHATRHGYWGSINSLCLRFASADGKTRMEVSVFVPWTGPGMERNDVELTTGTYRLTGYEVTQIGDRLSARISLAAGLDNPNCEVEYTPKGNDTYKLRIHDPAFPDSRYLTWSGKIVRSNVLL